MCHSEALPRGAKIVSFGKLVGTGENVAKILHIIDNNCMREHFDLAGDQIYFNTSAFGPLPRQSYKAGERALADRTQNFYEYSEKDYYADANILRELVAGLWNVTDQHVALIPSVSYGAQTAVNIIQPKSGSKIIHPTQDFPSDVYPWREWAKQNGCQLVAVPRPVNHDWTSAILQSIDKSVSVVSVPFCDWSNGTRFDLEKIAQATRAAGAKLVVDFSQAFGAQPLDLKKLNPDFAFSVGYKWQLGPNGLAYMFVNEAYWGERPLENNWQNRAGSDDKRNLINYTDGLRPGARRFDVGECSQVHNVPIAISSLQLIQKIGVDKIAAHNRLLIGRLAEVFISNGFTIPDLSFLAGHMIGVYHSDMPNMDKLVARLREQKVYTSARGAALRLGPHFFNTVEEVDRFSTILGREAQNR